MPQNISQATSSQNWLNITIGAILGLVSAYLGSLLYSQADNFCYPKGIVFCYQMGRTNIFIPLGLVMISLLLLSRINRIKKSALSILLTTLIFFFVGLVAYALYFFFIAPFFYA